MSKLGSWLRTPAIVTSLTSKVHLGAQDEADQLEDAMAGASLIMNDDMDGADAKLSLGDSAFHQLGSGITHFMRSMLGWEPEIMRNAALQLNEVENRAWADFKKSQGEGFGYTSKIYPAGTEFSLVLALAQLMGAVVAVLTESLTESIRGFYKLRKAYVSLDGIMAAEERYMKRMNELVGHSKTDLPAKAEKEIMPGGFDTPGGNSRPPTRNTSKTKLVDETKHRHIDVNGTRTPEDDSDVELVHADEAHSGAQTPADHLGHVDMAEGVDKQLQENSLNGRRTPEHVESDVSPMTPRERVEFDNGPESDIFAQPIDVFVHTGTSLCLGLLLLILGMVPPAFNRLLYVVGFKGDRERGLRMLWQCIRFNNINGGIAGLVLLGYYNGLLGFSDIVLTDADTKSENITGFPKERCHALLREMRTRYPVSGLWRFEEARMQSGNRRLRDAIRTLEAAQASSMKQITAITMFERALDNMYVHEYTSCAERSLDCVALNNWSHALYYFIAGAAQIEKYRDTRLSDPLAANVHREKAKEYLLKAPGQAGKKKFMAKQLPFDLYVVRKLQKWEQRAKEWKMDLIDVIGVSPLEEMIYLWNGLKRMNPEELSKSLENLAWARATHPEKHVGNLDETAVHALIKATILRNQQNFDEARALLKKEIFSHDKTAFKTNLSDDWSAPSAHYEMAVLSWFEKNQGIGQDGADPDGITHRKEKIKECDEYLQKAVKWDSYVLDARVGMKLGTAVETLRVYRLQWEL